MNFGRLRFVAERAELGERREVLMSVKVPERPGRWVVVYSCLIFILGRAPWILLPYFAISHTPVDLLRVEGLLS